MGSMLGPRWRGRGSTRRWAAVGRTGESNSGTPLVGGPGGQMTTYLDLIDGRRVISCVPDFFQMLHAAGVGGGPHKDTGLWILADPALGAGYVQIGHAHGLDLTGLLGLLQRFVGGEAPLGPGKGVVYQEEIDVISVPRVRRRYHEQQSQCAHQTRTGKGSRLRP